MEYLFNSHAILICRKCLYFIMIKGIIKNFKYLYVVYKCNCTKKINKVLLEKFIIYFQEDYLNGTSKKLSINNLMSKLYIRTIKKEFFCKCKKIPFKYCVECKKFVCGECLTKHYSHKKFTYNYKEFLNKKNFHKLEKYGHQSYITLKNCNSTIKSFLMKKVDKINSNIRSFIDYIEYNEQINDLLYALFKLLMNNFKFFPNISNYINLSYFSYFNLPFDFEPYCNKEVLNGNLIKILIHYLKSNFLISIKSDKKYFSLNEKYQIKRKEYFFNFTALRRKGYNRDIKKSKQIYYTERYVNVKRASKLGQDISFNEMQI